ncbi:hypothetical protein [Umezawaea sp. NPDC059074]|uniref:hypothetical protein n=1 Tax=Umezawaea sp. NPDC059074 TaxID=3346716 RepID=UPI0036B88CAC
MTKRALFAVLALIAGFVVFSFPQTAEPDHQSAAATAIVQAVHLPGAATRSGTTPQLPQGFIGHAPVDLTPRARPTLPLRILMDAAQRVHRAPETTSTTPLGDRAPPSTPQ